MFMPANSGLVAMEFLWENYQDKYNYSFVSVDEWVNEFFFCLLGGYSISYELNKSAYLVLKQKGIFNPNNEWDYEERMTERIYRELSKPQFYPLLSNGSYRTYRFPLKKGGVISKAGLWLKNTCNFQLDKIIGLYRTPQKNREQLLTCPGFGYKSASWLLRNIGLGDSLAIIDIHVYRFLKELNIIPNEWSIEKNYIEIEKSYCRACNIIGAKTDIMDLIIWTWDRENVN